MFDPTEIKTLNSYMERYGELLAGQTVKNLNPLQVPGRDGTHPILDTLRRPPLDAQRHCITAAVKTWKRQRSVVLVGEMGTGKTYMSMGSAHASANGRPYRALIMAPDHLLSKWEREINGPDPYGTIPDAVVIRFADWRDVLALTENRGQKPTRPEWYILGRDQSKFDPSWEGTAAIRKLHAREKDGGISTRTLLSCPKCGEIVMGKNDNPLQWEELQRSKRFCKAVADPSDENSPECGEPLWQYVGCKSKAKRAARKQRLLDAGRPSRIEPWRWAPARIIQKRLKGFFDYFILDEAHEEKSSESAQANAAAKLAASCKKTIALTGTLIGGYAWHTFPLLYRLAPSGLVGEGFEWGQEMKFTEAYGRIEETVTTSEGKGAEKKKSNAMSMGSEAKTQKRKACKPGIMPTLFGRHMMRNTIFLGLEEVSSALPPRPTDEVFALDMDVDVKASYDYIEFRISEAIAPMIQAGDCSLLAKMLQSLLSYPDYPFGWKESHYLEDFGIFEPTDYPEERIYPKEQALIDLVLAERDAGRQVWVYTTMTGVRDTAGRLLSLFRNAGLRADCLRSSVDRKHREDWITEKGRHLDVAISHPKLVETGLDLFNLKAGVNFATICWYQTGYNLFTLRQASRRAWRIGQPLNCRVVYFYYKGTMQERAMTLMGQKLAAAEALDGKFSAEGLAAMAGDDSAEMALARSLSDRIVSADRIWEKFANAPRQPLLILPPSTRVPDLRCGDSIFDVTSNAEEAIRQAAQNAPIRRAGKRGHSSLQMSLWK